MTMSATPMLLRVLGLGSHTNGTGASARTVITGRLRSKSGPGLAEDINDPLDHPVLKAMSARELADIPFDRFCGRPGDEANDQRG